MKANLIKSLRNKIELVDIEAGRSARANFPDVNFDNAVLLINGRISEPDTIPSWRIRHASRQTRQSANSRK